MNDLKLAACGIDCAECASYKVTMENDIVEAEKLIEWYRGNGWINENEGAEAILAKNPLCTGCWSSVKDDCFFKCGCGSCDFRICCTEKHINHCGECDVFPCEYYREWASWTDSHKIMENLLSQKNTKN